MNIYQYPGQLEQEHFIAADVTSVTLQEGGDSNPPLSEHFFT